MYKLVYTITYMYVRVQSVLFAFKKVQTGLEPSIFCIPIAEHTLTLRGTDLSCLDVGTAVVNVYIHCYCNQPCLCTWFLMINQRRWSCIAATIGHDIPSHS